MPTLRTLVEAFAAGLVAADALAPVEKTYNPGIGAFGEEGAIRLIVAQLARVSPTDYAGAGPQPYPDLDASQTCDLVTLGPGGWAIEVKHARPLRNNGRLEDTGLKKLLSPYPDDHSVVTDARRLRASGFTQKRAVLVYCFDPGLFALDPALNFCELLLMSEGATGPREEIAYSGLVHPHHRNGRVVAWEVLP